MKPNPYDIKIGDDVWTIGPMKVIRFTKAGWAECEHYGHKISVPVNMLLNTSAIDYLVTRRSKQR